MPAFAQNACGLPHCASHVDNVAIDLCGDDKIERVVRKIKARCVTNLNLDHSSKPALFDTGSRRVYGMGTRVDGDNPPCRRHFFSEFACKVTQPAADIQAYFSSPGPDDLADPPALIDNLGGGIAPVAIPAFASSTV